MSDMNVQNNSSLSFKVHIHDGKTPFPDDDIYYIIAKEGIFLKKKLDLMDSLVPVTKISTLQSIQTNIKMHIPKIPLSLFSQAVSFFRYVYDSYYSESVILLFYNKIKRDYKLIVPPQKVSSTFCQYESKIHIDDYLRIGDIHSHSNFAAFHSSTDEDDEKSFDGIHITVGHVQNDMVSVSVSLVSNGSRCLVQATDYIEGLIINNGKFKVLSRYFPDKWKNQVSKFEPKFKFTFLGKEITNNSPVDFLRSQSQSNTSSPLIPCLTCKYRDIKLLLEDDDELLCEDCQATFPLDKCNGACPVCGSTNIDII